MDSNLDHQNVCSAGFGDAWLKAGFQGWGTVMHDDITAGARWLVKTGVADPARLCILGWSYGGYAALIGAVKEPSLYRCAVSIAGAATMSRTQMESRAMSSAASYSACACA